MSDTKVDLCPVSSLKFIWQNVRLIRNSLCLSLKGALSGLRQVFASESPSKMMKNAFFLP